MKINTVERLAVNNPARRWLIGRHLERFRAWRPEQRWGDVLEIGCGNGAGMAEIDRRLAPRRLVGMDLDERQVARAQRRIPRLRAAVSAVVADAECLSFADAEFDAVVELTIFHHIPAWERALAEVARVLRPGGAFYFEELTREYHFDVPVLSFAQQKFTVHPWDTIPPKARFLEGIQAAGLTVLHTREWFVRGWLLGVAVKPISPQ